MGNDSADTNYTRDLKNSSTSMIPIGMFVVLSFMNIFLSITASLGNALILVALHKESSLHPPTKLLFRCLTFTDLFVGLISQPLLVAEIIFSYLNAGKYNSYLNEGHAVSSYIFCGISALTSTAISVDRLLALLLGLRYRHVVTLRRVRVVLICFWLYCMLCGPMFSWSYHAYWIAVVITTVLSLIASIISYTKIYFTIWQRQAQVQEHVHQGQQNGGGLPLNMGRYKKTVSSIAWVQLALLACYVPFLITSILRHTMTYGGALYLSARSTTTLLYLNSSLNPILYCWKIKEVREAVKDTISQFC